MNLLTLLFTPLIIVLAYAVFVFALVGLAALLMWVLDHDIFL